MFQHIATMQNNFSDNATMCFFFLFMQERLKALTDIVWPEIALLVKGRISQARQEGI